MRVSRSHQTPTKDKDVRCDELTEFLNDKCLFKFPINVYITRNMGKQNSIITGILMELKVFNQVEGKINDYGTSNQSYK